MIRIIEKKWKVNSLYDNIYNKFKKYFDNFPFRSERFVRDDAVRTEKGKIITIIYFLFSVGEVSTGVRTYTGKIINNKTQQSINNKLST